MISLCDVNLAENIRDVWDYRHGVGEGAYSHYHNGGKLKKYIFRNSSSSFST